MLMAAAGWILMLLTCSSVISFGSSTTVSDGGAGGSSDNHLEIYKRLFSLKRKEQIQTAERVWRADNYEKQYKTIKFLMDTIFPVLKQALLDVANMNYTPDDPFPEELEKREILGKIYENVLLFGDVLLRMPDMTKKIYKENKREWSKILEESVQFCNASKKLFTGPHATQLNLLAQEIGILPESEDYINPFRASQAQVKAETPSKKRGKMKQKTKSRPKLRGSTMTNRIEL